MPEVNQAGKSRKRVNRKTGTIADKIGSLTAETEGGINLNVFGRAGTGKTTFCSTFPGKILFLVCSGGNRSGELRSINTAKNRKRIDKIELESVQDFSEAIEYVRESDKYKTVVLDHATSFQDLVLKEVLGLDEIPVTKDWGLARQQDYGTCTTQCKNLFASMLNLSQNVVIVAQEREFTFDNGDGDDDPDRVIQPYISSGLMPSLCGWLNYAVDNIVQTFIRRKEDITIDEIGDETVEIRTPGEGVEYCLRVGASTTYTIKFRVPGGVKERVIVDPSYSKIKQLIDDAQG